MKTKIGRWGVEGHKQEEEAQARKEQKQNRRGRLAGRKLFTLENA